MLETSGRLLTLLSLLQARRDWPGALLADRLGVSPRTVRRDVDRLRELGYPVNATKGPDGGYRLAAGADLPPLLFDDEQAVAVAVALRTGAIPGAEEGALRALATIRQVMPARLRARLDALEVTTVRRRPERSAAVDPDALLTLGAACRAREVVRFDYAGGTMPAVGEGEAAFRPPRRVEPYHLVTADRRWYLVAFDLDRADWRLFRVDRITPRSGTGPRFTRREVPGGDAAAFVAARLSGPTHPVRGEVVLHARAEDIARWAGPDAVCEPLPDVDGEPRCRVVLGSWSWGGLAGWLGVFDVPFEVVGPPELVEATRRLAARYAAATA
ncbi:helix-turn-helix transcriptional regulator [Promicromonospora citrea]|uniref:DeoR family transcriptional regulator n=1 Tax=Promicromonospora citrea TaxID=43677 RepID=A0A8H9GQL4_9MICO|nr:WYL domain-containing protein [Promicromonospora citrea]NNH53163.1 WYL domain-containing protein [Promicromonospora citrea]GGM42271.1 DeoR family transcriptional regulator [Promicromonospora citrea]